MENAKSDSELRNLLLQKKRGETCQPHLQYKHGQAY